MVVAEGERIVDSTTAIAALDVATSLATLATQRGYTRPVLKKNESPETKPIQKRKEPAQKWNESIHIEGGRHPVVEAAQADQRERAATFVSNDCVMSPEVLIYNFKRKKEKRRKKKRK